MKTTSPLKLQWKSNAGQAYQKQLFWKRFLDLVLLFGSAVVWIPLLCGVAVVLRFTSTGPVLYWSERVGVGNRIFKMPKFRSMRPDTPPLASNLLLNPARYVTRLGAFLRQTSLDELPQVWNILKGEMSWVGPRPVLLTENALISQRKQHHIHTLLPGLTGLAQINGRDRLSLDEKLRLDVDYLQHWSLGLDLKILCITVVKVLLRDGILH